MFLAALWHINSYSKLFCDIWGNFLLVMCKEDSLHIILMVL